MCKNKAPPTINYKEEWKKVKKELEEQKKYFTALLVSQKEYYDAIILDLKTQNNDLKKALKRAKDGSDASVSSETKNFVSDGILSPLSVSEYEIPPVILKKSKSTKVETLTNQDTDDFFKDMTPKVETVELMRQLETKFNVNSDNSNQPIKSPTSFSNKFGIRSQDYDDNKEIESGNNNWDE